MFKGHTVRVNTYFALFVITLFGVAATFFILRVSDEIVMNYDIATFNYEYNQTYIPPHKAN